MQSDLSNAAKLIKLYYTESGTYPTTANITETSTGTYCITGTSYCYKASSGNTIEYIGIPTNNDFFLITQKDTTKYYIKSDGSPTQSTNLLSTENASFEGGTIGNWWFGTGGATNFSDWSYNGVKSIRFALSSHPGDSARLNIYPLVIPGVKYTASAQLNSVDGSYARTILYDNISGSTAGNSITEGSSRLSTVTKTINTSASGVALYINNGSWPSDIYADAIKLEIGSTATPF